MGQYLCPRFRRSSYFDQ